MKSCESVLNETQKELNMKVHQFGLNKSIKEDMLEKFDSLANKKKLRRDRNHIFLPANVTSKKKFLPATITRDPETVFYIASESFSNVEKRT